MKTKKYKDPVEEIFEGIFFTCIAPLLVIAFNIGGGTVAGGFIGADMGGFLGVIIGTAAGFFVGIVVTILLFLVILLL